MAEQFGLCSPADAAAPSPAQAEVRAGLPQLKVRGTFSMRC